MIALKILEVGSFQTRSVGGSTKAITLPLPSGRRATVVLLRDLYSSVRVFVAIPFVQNGTKGGR
jgi:hypothetical protein